jgi:endonuclease/exonuclease/phosphatase family metal-dependent hydrolase
MHVTNRLRHRPIFSPLGALLLCASVAAFGAPRAAASPAASLTFDDLKTLSGKDAPAEALERLEVVLSTPVVDNSASRRSRPRRPEVPGLGRVLRVAQWNIERGLEFEEIVSALRGGAAFDAYVDDAQLPPGSRERRTVLESADRLRDADVLVINELDVGLKRTEYRDVPRDLARALGMNYAFGVEFVEVDPLLLGTEDLSDLDEKDAIELRAQLTVDPARTRGLHGTAILSRYPLENVRLLRFATQGHDWFAGELKSVSKLEKGKRNASERLLLEKISREVRRGGRMALIADVSDPAFPGGKVTIVAPHFENKGEAKYRVAQLEEVLAFVKDVPNPVVIAGDMNTTAGDGTPTSLRREIRKKLGSGRFWVERGIKYATGLGLAIDAVKGVGAIRRMKDPTAKNVKIFAENPEAKFFKTLEAFRFSDGSAFDFRGDGERSFNGRSGTLANSNERERNGFDETFKVARTYGEIGQLKLDWIFVKPPSLTDPSDRKQPYLFAPHRGETHNTLNYAVADRISDHSPLTVDLPLAEPPIDR